MELLYSSFQIHTSGLKVETEDETEVETEDKTEDGKEGKEETSSSSSSFPSIDDEEGLIRCPPRLTPFPSRSTSSPSRARR